MTIHIASPQAAGLFVFLCCILLWARFRRQRRNIPPGPAGISFFGSALQLPATFQERTFARWGKTYGDVVYVKFFNRPTLILNSVEAARDLLDKRSAKYSDRPRMVLFTEMIGQETSLPSIGYGDQLRMHRRWMFDGVGNKDKLRSYQVMQHREVFQLLRSMAKTPERFYDHIHLYLAALLTEVAYGRRVSSLDDELVQIAERGIEGSNNIGSPGSMLVDFFPILKHIPKGLPGAGFKRRAEAVHNDVIAWKETGFRQFMADYDSGIAPPCMFTTVRQELGESPGARELEDMKGLTFSVYGAGVETSRGTLLTFILAMVRNPHVLRKAHEEMDNVVGNDRLPEFRDKASLPYLGAVLEEVFRWHAAVPLAIPHRLMVDDEYRGWNIPAGCMVIPNTWAMTRDERYYPEPEEFRPERYLTTDGQMDGEVLLPSSFIFGYGRRQHHRICPGQAFAEATIWLAIAHMVALFDIHKAVDEFGEEVTPPPAFQSGFTNQPVPFVCQIRLRSEKAAAMLAQLDL
ncbi:cytochrome P450 [Trametes coccinea BRFM310]|uniref:Cytochrome P450 n=1 Tax=Trametes coccinea (strain BRFM310) TaxID=1353009 RepID=A0A1Y2IRU4_TRAC3|nr:cytochrome P450 [Trametes coccinea BRFM310]